MKFSKILNRFTLASQILGSVLPGYRPSVYYVVPEANWSTDWDGRYITQNVRGQFGLRAHLISNPRWLAGQIIHYGSLWEAVGSLGSKQNLRNAIVATIFHGDRQGDNDTLAEAVDQLIENQEQFEKIVVANRIMENRFRDWGVPAEKIERIPLGVDLTLFKPSSLQARANIRNRLGIPEDAFCVGSFQKDGVGWEEGLQPKLIKGPDILVEVLAKLAKRHKLHVLLTAPTRGYVRRGLEKAGIAYTHRVFENYPDLAPLYGALDAYLVTSREEGGPKGVLEALASGIPLVSTEVGMAPDVITHGEDGLLAPVEDVSSLLDHLNRIAEDKLFAGSLVAAGRTKVAAFDWVELANQYYELVYRPLLKDRVYV
ncbi:MAG: glycosyltransferase [Chloroflexi bacterium]|nr:glycosyltransferase [Chloroflexota bacterium]